SKSPGGWLPSKWTVAQYRGKPAVLAAFHEMEVQTAIVDPETTLADFQLAIAPGMKVWDLRSERKYIAGSGWGWLPWALGAFAFLCVIGILWRKVLRRRVASA